MFIPIRRSDTWLFYFCLMLMGILSSPVIAYNTADPPTKGKMKIIRRSSPYRGAKLPFLEITGGYSIWAQSPQTNFKYMTRATFITLEYGNSQSPISFGMGALANANFLRDALSLQNQYGFIFGKYRYNYLLSSSSSVTVYVMAGINTWQSSLDNLGTVANEFSIPGNQRDTGFGAIAGTGIQYRYQAFGIGSQFTWLTGKATYVTAGEPEVGALTGSMHISVILSYRFLWGQKKILCPIYSK